MINIVLLRELGNNMEDVGITEKDVRLLMSDLKMVSKMELFRKGHQRAELVLRLKKISKPVEPHPVNPVDHDFGEEEHEYGIK